MFNKPARVLVPNASNQNVVETILITFMLQTIIIHYSVIITVLYILFLSAART